MGVVGGKNEGDLTISNLPATQALNPLLNALRGNGFANVAEALDFTEDHGSFIGLAAEVNKGNWLLIGEWTKTSIDDSCFYNRKQYFIRRCAPLSQASSSAKSSTRPIGATACVGASRPTSR